jgi:carboxypeptidase C (cathepsin A)
MIAGKRVDYSLTVGSLPLRDDKGKLTGEVVYTAYTVPGRDSVSRPVTFCFNGGPGAASAYLNLGVLGPRRLHFDGKADYASKPPMLEDNPGSWLDFTDLVFIDPIGTGYSRSRLGEEDTKKTFLSAESDIHYLSDVVNRWLTQNNRQPSPKYLLGESYGGYRVARMAAYLQTIAGVGVSGITIVSGYLDPPLTAGKDGLSPFKWAVDLPSMAAAAKEKRGEPITPESMAPIERYARTAFITDFLAGPQDGAATDRLSAEVARLTGLDPTLVRRLDGRVRPQLFIRELHRDEGEVGSFYEPNLKSPDPFPEEEQGNYIDPELGFTAPFQAAMVDLVNNGVGWRIDAPYNLNNYDVSMKFQRDDQDTPVRDLRKAVANDPTMAVTIAHGWNDLACPYFVSKLLLAQMPTFGVKNRIALHVYPGGHMFYIRPASATAFRHDAIASYGIAAR